MKGGWRRNFEIRSKERAKKEIFDRMNRIHRMPEENEWGVDSDFSS
jgi:hypothetical protein